MLSCDTLTLHSLGVIWQAKPFPQQLSGKSRKRLMLFQACVHVFEVTCKRLLQLPLILGLLGAMMRRTSAEYLVGTKRAASLDRNLCQPFGNA
jgi:hypothetical protein